MSTTTRRPITRVTVERLPPNYGTDKNKPLKLVIDGSHGKTLLHITPLRTRRTETIELLAVYHYAVRCRVNKEQLEKAREKKAKLTEQRRRKRLNSQERRFTARIKAVS